jgi:hypothetical protein
MSELLTNNHESRIGSTKSSFKTVGDGEKSKKLHTSSFIPLPSSSASASSSSASNNIISNEKNKSLGEHKLLNGLLSKPLNSGGLSSGTPTLSAPMTNVSSNVEMAHLQQPQGLSASIEQILKSAIISSTKSTSLSPSSTRNQYSSATK